jgi:hypothetical protein
VQVGREGGGKQRRLIAARVVAPIADEQHVGWGGRRPRRQRVVQETLNRRRVRASVAKVIVDCLEIDLTHAQPRSTALRNERIQALTPAQPAR